ncbi:hypothetical protein GGX14DRAFT_625178 [Mycena pura]|uniref:YEATS domain-containing protein n=1 Tax=Mycena pura TaxID=153505 RepID=A0AAD6YC54_9AGAR|nr:hypothetical protein GGX14DRAFT_625178 [Mycena pura]
MDPLSISMSCLTLISAVSAASSSVTDFIVNCRSARIDLEAIARELSDLEITLRIIQIDGADDGGDAANFPDDLQRNIANIVTNCTHIIGDLETLLQKYQDVGRLERSAQWALTGRKEAEKMRVSLAAHKGALNLVIDATALHMAKVIKADTAKISSSTSEIQAYTMQIAEQLTKQDEILEQIAWIRAIISQRPAARHGPSQTMDEASQTMVDGESQTMVDGESQTKVDGESQTMDRYLDSVSDYAGSVYGESVSDEVAEEMHRLSIDDPESTSSARDSLAASPAVSLFLDPPDSMTLVLGNTHHLVEPQPETHWQNRHLWSFYLKASGSQIIEEVVVDLHPTFDPQVIILKHDPFRVTRLGWGYFVIAIKVELKAGFIWQKTNSSTLKLEWELDFEGMGSSASNKYAFEECFNDRLRPFQHFVRLLPDLSGVVDKIQWVNTHPDEVGMKRY